MIKSCTLWFIIVLFFSPCYAFATQIPFSSATGGTYALLSSTREFRSGVEDILCEGASQEFSRETAFNAFSASAAIVYPYESSKMEEYVPDQTEIPDLAGLRSESIEQISVSQEASIFLICTGLIGLAGSMPLKRKGKDYLKLSHP